jgi:hypothetical protein
MRRVKLAFVMLVMTCPFINAQGSGPASEAAAAAAQQRCPAGYTVATTVSMRLKAGTVSMMCSVHVLACAVQA